MFWTKSLIFIGLLGVISGQRNGYIPPVNNFATSQGTTGGQVSGGISLPILAQGPISSNIKTPVGRPVGGGNVGLASSGGSQSSGGRPITGSNFGQDSIGTSQFTTGTGQLASDTGDISSSNVGQSESGTTSSFGQGPGIELASVSGVFDYHADEDYSNVDDFAGTFGAQGNELGIFDDYSGGAGISGSVQESETGTFVDFTDEANTFGGQANAIGSFGDYSDVVPLDSIEALAAAIAGGGVPGEDYAILASIPETGFECEGFAPGYYADISDEAKCQVFHICQEDGRHDAFLCPNGTMFNQQYFVCDWWYNVVCEDSELYFDLNLEFGKIPDNLESNFDYDVTNNFQEDVQNDGFTSVDGSAIEFDYTTEDEFDSAIGSSRPGSAVLGTGLTASGIGLPVTGLGLSSPNLIGNLGVPSTGMSVTGPDTQFTDFGISLSSSEIGEYGESDVAAPTLASTTGINLPLGLVSNTSPGNTFSSDSSELDSEIAINFDYEQAKEMSENQFANDYDYQTTANVGIPLPFDLGAPDNQLETMKVPMVNDEKLIVSPDVVSSSITTSSSLQLQDNEGYNYNSPSESFKTTNTEIGIRGGNGNRVSNGNRGSNGNRIRNNNIRSNGNRRRNGNRNRNGNDTGRKNDARRGNGNNRRVDINRQENRNTVLNTNVGDFNNKKINQNLNKPANSYDKQEEYTNGQTIVNSNRRSSTSSSNVDANRNRGNVNNGLSNSNTRPSNTNGIGSINIGGSKIASNGNSVTSNNIAVDNNRRVGNGNRRGNINRRLVNKRRENNGRRRGNDNRRNGYSYDAPAGNTLNLNQINDKNVPNESTRPARVVPLQLYSTPS